MKDETAPADPVDRGIAKAEYKRELHGLEIELVKLQRHFIGAGERILVLLEGRDSAGKDGVIKRMTKHMSPRETIVWAPPKPSDRDRGSWYFQRFVPHLPAAEEFVIFNRSWYNRAGVERVMGYCTDAEYHEFMETVLDFEHMLVRSGIKLFKYYLDIGKAEQKKRLKARRKDPLKQWKTSPVDAVAVEHWKDYSHARNEMFARTHDPLVPWTVVRAGDKRLARLNLIRDLLFRLDYEKKDVNLLRIDPEIVFEYRDVYLERGMIAP